MIVVITQKSGPQNETQKFNHNIYNVSPTYLREKFGQTYVNFRLKSYDLHSYRFTEPFSSTTTIKFLLNKISNHMLLHKKNTAKIITKL